MILMDESDSGEKEQVEDEDEDHHSTLVPWNELGTFLVS